MVSLFVDPLPHVPDYEESAESPGSPTTSETGETFFYKGKESKEPTPFDATPNPDKSRQGLKTLDSCRPRSRKDSDSEILSLLEECYSLKESFSDPFHSPSGGLSLNETLHMMDEDGEDCQYPDLSNYPALVALKPQIGSSVCLLELEEDAPDTGNLFDPERRLDIYRALIRHLSSSDFPFSRHQLTAREELSNKVFLLHRLFKECDEKSFRKQEIEFKSDLDHFIDLLKYTEYENISPVRINRYISAIISELDFLIEDESRPITSPSNPDYFFFDPASYLIISLLKAFPDSSEHKIAETYFAKRKESNIEFVRIFATTKFPFTTTQKSVIREISQSVISTTGDPDSEEDRTFQVQIQKLLLVLNFYDEGPRDGISNIKKVRSAYRQLLDDLFILQQAERRIIQDFEFCSLHSADMVKNFVESLRLNFIPRYSERLFN